MVDDVLQDGDPPCTCEQRGDGRQDRPVHRGERTAVHVEPGDRLEDGLLGDVHRNHRVVGRQPGEKALQVGEPARGQQHDRGRWPAASARPRTVELSAMYRPLAGSCRERSATSVRET